MRLKECMSTCVETVTPDTSAQAAWERMKQRRIRHLVVMKDHQAAGVVSERDLGGHRGALLRSGRSVGELMTPFVVSLAPEATVRQAANVMRGWTIGCIPVVAAKKVIGIVTVSDLLAWIGRGAQRPAPQGGGRRRQRAVPFHRPGGRNA